MAETTGISWADKTWSPWIGCQKVSPACDGCYAEHLMDTRMGRVTWGPHGERVRTSAGYWKQLRAWDRKAAASGERVTVFPSLCDPFDKVAPPGALRDFFDEIRATPHLTYLLLTKRPQMIERLYGEAHLDPPDGGGGYEWPRNAWAGTTCEDQPRADTNVPALLRAKAALRIPVVFLSIEPLLGPTDLERAGAFSISPGGAIRDAAGGQEDYVEPHLDTRRSIDWVITGGETDQGKHKARPTHPDWLRTIRDQCAAAGVPYHHKQNGEWQGYGAAAPTDADGNLGLPCEPKDSFDFPCGERVFRVGKKRSGRLLDGILHDAMPAVRA